MSLIEWSKQYIRFNYGFIDICDKNSIWCLELYSHTNKVFKFNKFEELEIIKFENIDLIHINVENLKVENILMMVQTLKNNNYPYIIIENLKEFSDKIRGLLLGLGYNLIKIYGIEEAWLLHDKFLKKI